MSFPSLLTGGSTYQVPSSVLTMQRSTTTSSVASSPNKCNIYIGGESNFNHEKGQVSECLNKSNLHFQENDPDFATHFILLITDKFLKSKEYLLPLIYRLKNDPHFKQRLFPIVMDDSIKKYIYTPGCEEPYVKHWSDALVPINRQSSQYGEVEMIRDNIAIFVQTLRVTLMPNSMSELLVDDMASVTETIKKRPHLLEKKRFFSLPLLKAYGASGRETILVQLSSIFLQKSVVYVTGEKGIGKTTLAVEYAKRFVGYTTGIILLDATNKETLDKSFQHLATQLEMNIESAKRTLQQMEDFLIIYDNVSDLNLIPKIRSGHTIIIGRDLANPDIVVERFTDKEADAYIQQEIQATAEEARHLCALLDNHPARLTEELDYIKRTKISVGVYLRSNRTNPSTILQTADFKATLPTPSEVVALSQPYLDAFVKKSVDALFQDLRDEDIQIFVSYNWGATPEVDKVDKMFGDKGIKLLRDTREAKPFESLRKFMKKVIRVADYTLSIVSQKYLESFNCLYEVTTLMQDPHWKSRIFPILMPGTVLNSATIQNCKQHWLDKAAQIEGMGGSAAEVAIAREGADKIVTFLQFVNEVEPAPLSNQLKTQFQRTIALMLARQEKLEKKGLYKQDIFYLPMGRNKNFTGREKELSDLKTCLSQGRFSAITNTGMGGVGKTQLALEYAYKYEKEYQMIFWIRAEHMESLQSDLRMLGQEMEILDEFLKDDRLIATMRGELEKRTGWLIVFDNAENKNSLAEIMPQRGGHVIVTSRDPNWEQPLKIEVYSPEEALNYLKKISGVTGQDEDLRSLAHVLGYLPLALTQAGAYIKRQGITVAAYCTLYQQREKELLSQKEKGYPESVATTWSMSVEKIKQKNPHALPLLTLCSYLAPDHIPAVVLEAWLEEKTGQSGLAFHEALEVLESYSLITQRVVQEQRQHLKSVFIHRLVQSITRNEQERVDAEQAVSQGLTVLSRQFKGDVGTEEERALAELLFQHVKSLSFHAESLNLISRDRGAILNEMGEFLWTMGDLKEAKVCFEKAHGALWACPEPKPYVDLAKCSLGLGKVHESENDFDRAKKAFEEALRIQLDHYANKNHIDIAKSYVRLSQVLNREEAQTHLQRALDIQRACHLGENHPDVANTYVSWGHNQESPEKMTEYYVKALNIFTTYYKTDNHISVAKLYTYLGNVAKGNEATEYFEKSLKIKTAYYGGENYASVGYSHQSYGQKLLDGGDLEGAKKHAEKALKIYTVCYKGYDHPDTGECHTLLAKVFERKNEIEEAKKHLLTAVASHGNLWNYKTIPYNQGEIYHFLGKIYQRQNNLIEAQESYEFGILYTGDVVSTAKSFFALGEVLQNSNLIKSYGCYEQAVKSYTAVHGGENHLDVANGYQRLGIVSSELDYLHHCGLWNTGWQKTKRLKRTQEHFEKALKIRADFYKDENHPDLAESHRGLGSSLRTQKDLKGAKQAYENALKIEASYYQDHSQTSIAKTYAGLGEVFIDQGDFDQAQSYLEKALSIQTFHYPDENHVDIAELYTSLGHLSRKRGELIKASEYYEKALKIGRFCYGTEKHIRIGTLYHNLGQTVEKEDRKKAKEHYEKSLEIKAAVIGTLENPSQIDTYHNLWRLLAEEGDTQGSKEAYRKAQTIFAACAGGEYDTDEADAQLGLGYVLEIKSDLPAAKAAYEKALELYTACHKGENHPDVARTCHALAKLSQDPAEKKALFGKARNIYLTCYKGKNMIDMAHNYYQFGLFMSTTRDLFWAVDYLEKSLKIYIECHGKESHVDVATCHYSLGTTWFMKEIVQIDKPVKEINLFKSKYLKKISEHYETAIKIYTDCAKPKAIRCVADAYLGLATVLKEQWKGAFLLKDDLLPGQIKEKLDYRIRALISYYGTENHYRIAEAYEIIGKLLLEIGLETEAKEAGRKASEISLHCGWYYRGRIK